MFTSNWISSGSSCVIDAPVSVINVSNPSGANFVFIASTTGGQSPYTYQWMVTPSTGFTNNTGNLTSSTLDLTIATEGSYTMKLITTDDNGKTHTVAKSIVYSQTLGSFDDSFDNSFD